MSRLISRCLGARRASSWLFTSLLFTTATQAWAWESKTPKGLHLPEMTKAEALATLKEAWPMLEASCYLSSRKQCVQRGDLDGDGRADVVIAVKPSGCTPSSDCAGGVVIISSRRKHLRVGAGASPALLELEWEIDQDTGEQTWEVVGEEGGLEDYSVVGEEGGMWVSPTTRKTLCARAMKQGHDVLVISGSDAAEAIAMIDDSWVSVRCGY